MILITGGTGNVGANLVRRSACGGPASGHRRRPIPRSCRGFPQLPPHLIRQVRFTAVLAMAQTGWPECGPLIEQAARDDDDDGVREIAEHAMRLLPRMRSRTTSDPGPGAGASDLFVSPVPRLSTAHFGAYLGSQCPRGVRR